MVARVSTFAFQGIETVNVEVQVMIAPGKSGVQIVGLPDKAVAESRERVQAALHSTGLSLPHQFCPPPYKMLKVAFGRILTCRLHWGLWLLWAQFHLMR